MKRTRLLAAPVVALAVLAAACNANSTSNSKSQPKAAKGGTLYILTDQPTVELDPAKSQNLGTTTLHLFQRGLTTWKEAPGQSPTVVGDLATDTGTPSDNGKVWTYHLKTGLKYSNGKPIVAQDVKYGLERSFDPSLAGGLNYHKTLLVGGGTYKGPFSGKQLASIETPNATTIIFHLNKSFGDWPWIASMPAFSPVPKASDTDPVNYGKHPVSSGPYSVQSLKQGKELIGVRNKYWSKDDIRSGQASKIVLDMGLSDSTVNNRLITDQGNDKDAISYVSLQAPLLPKVQGNPSVKSRLSTGSGALTYLAMNVKRKALSNLKVRQAIEYAVDKKSVQVAAGGPTIGGDIASTLITPGLNGYQKYNAYQAPDGGDVKKAKSLLASAGYAKGLTLTMLVDTSVDTTVSESEAIQAALKRAGITVKFRQLDSDAWTADATGNKSDYDLTVSSWLADYPSAAGAIQPLFGADQIGNQGYNISRYTTGPVDAAINAAIGETDQSKAESDWAALDKKIMGDAPVVPLLYAKNAFLRGSQVANFYLPPYPPYPNLLVLGLSK
ncbi:MAG TPA: ABC transporter substrate-binding protein [Mycobacteriales bacterium]|jgi:peptide/nickel transport system substrate-binding protein|nr:ABC transporter substrate-binding protein [Mycobacteriales bacterium]